MNGNMTSSQLSLRGVSIPAGHIIVNEKYQGSLLTKVLQGEKIFHIWFWIDLAFYFFKLISIWNR